MNLGLWIAAVGGLWLISSIVLALILGPVFRKRSEEVPLAYPDQSGSVVEPAEAGEARARHLRAPRAWPEGILQSQLSARGGRAGL